MQVKVRKDVIKSDVLIIGGGIAGLQAAIAAAEKGAKVIITEKADTRRSGSGSTGNDHFMCYIPEYHGNDFNEIILECSETLVGPIQDFDLFRLMMERSFELVQKWESYGISMRPTGKWSFMGHAMPGRRRYHLKYDGHDQKPCLTKEALRQGAKIMNKTPICELLKNDEGRIVGAIGINIADEEPEVVVFQAKSVILGTGDSPRLYPGPNPAYPFNTAFCPASSGSGQAMALRAGARLVNLDLPYNHAGPKYFARCGKATWIGVLSDIKGKPIGPFVSQPTRELGDVMADIWPGVFKEKMDDGTGPVYMNCSGTSDDDLDYMMKAFASEGDTSLVDYFDQYNLDLHKDMFEFTTYEYTLTARGPDIGLDSSTTVPGLYAAGNMTGNVRGDITSAAVFGQISGESASEYAKTVGDYDVSNHPLVTEKIELCNKVLGREVGAHWKEANSMLQQIMNDYVGMKVRSESLMKAGLSYVRDLKRYAHEQLMAENAHELMRALEVFDLIEVGEAVAICSENRKETRGTHKRTDFTYTNPLLNNKFQTIELTKDGFKTEFRNKKR
ncbi:succinate dehydrogenase/fumarate reductase flavoprotein subunit [Desulfitobacterium dichloroeliminans LMG P-21439]|uniref:Succinate dehydrogenase/fumarate reductase flavoprotein subunit n=1 Tax=Desulfitobacterium dichloroeliminans (strain LMG P-21439 / DCA1) TaxID=871963 RepID=L0F744_DESDL|nr:FAD-dependent oxidoreductase [Desulfitobacterium dichloroeliminans]AGA68992.1 succinate dehydrogenase/fumarate reductase flavoprotein subunit [Desulfitobacterium dichloroeliminans LMG P-21439]